MFFWCNFLAVRFEMAVSKYLPTARKPYLLRRMGLGARAVDVLSRVLGFLRICVFLIWLAPRLIYPKMYHTLSAAIVKSA